MTKRTQTLFSEGTRISADLFLPDTPKPEAGYPAILLCHGWGGLKHQLVYTAAAFARAGFAAMTFDYRGWGESDGRVIAMNDAEPLLTGGETTLKVRVLREIADPIDQTADAVNCLFALAADPEIDRTRLGVWGTSFGGGHAVFLAGQYASHGLIKAVFAQVGGFGLMHPYREHAQGRVVDKVRGQLDPSVPQGIDQVPGLMGTPDSARMLMHEPLRAARDVRVPTMIVDAEHEELMKPAEHGRAAYEIIRHDAVSEYVVLPCAHYGIYYEFFEQATDMAVNWFTKYL